MGLHTMSSTWLDQGGLLTVHAEESNIRTQVSKLLSTRSTAQQWWAMETYLQMHPHHIHIYVYAYMHIYMQICIWMNATYYSLYISIYNYECTHSLTQGAMHWRC